MLQAPLKLIPSFLSEILAKYAPVKLFYVYPVKPMVFDNFFKFTTKNTSIWSRGIKSAKRFGLVLEFSMNQKGRFEKNVGTINSLSAGRGRGSFIKREILASFGCV